MARERSAIPPADYAIFESGDGKAPPIVGRVVAKGLSDEHGDLRYIIVEATDGRAWHVELGLEQETPARQSIVRVSATPTEIRQADRTVAEVAAAYSGRYSEDIHRRHDPTATHAFTEAHVRRLEAIRRGTGGVTREVSGAWIIAPDHVVVAEAHEREVARRKPIGIETRASQPLDRLAR